MKFSGIVPNNIIYHLKWFEQNRYCSFWEMVQKPPKNTVFLTWIIQKFFFRKKGFVIFLRISISNFWPKISKILRAVLCNFCVIDGLTNQHSQAWPQLKLRTATSLSDETHQRKTYQLAKTEKLVNNRNFGLFYAYSAAFCITTSYSIKSKQIKVDLHSISRHWFHWITISIISFS